MRIGIETIRVTCPHCHEKSIVEGIRMKHVKTRIKRADGALSIYRHWLVVQCPQCQAEWSVDE